MLLAMVELRQQWLKLRRASAACVVTLMTAAAGMLHSPLGRPGSTSTAVVRAAQQKQMLLLEDIYSCLLWCGNCCILNLALF
jgi:hypothetical protein